MRLIRTLITPLLCLMLLASLAPAGAVDAPQGGPCCGHETSGDNDLPRGCDTHDCAAACCRTIPAQADTLALFVICIEVAREAPAHPPASLLSLTDHNAIFHPPRA